MSLLAIEKNYFHIYHLFAPSPSELDESVMAPITRLTQVTVFDFTMFESKICMEASYSRGLV
jgi:hypothetical protein